MTASATRATPAPIVVAHDHLALVVLGRLSRQALAKARQKLNLAGQRGKQVLGAFMLLIGALILSGADKTFEAWVLQHAPDWLVRLTTSI